MLNTIAEDKKNARTMELAKQFYISMPIEKLKARLNDFKDDISILESIYMTGGKLNLFSKTFQDAAHKERQEVCLITSALHTIIRDKEKEATLTTTTNGVCDGCGNYKQQCTCLEQSKIDFLNYINS
jgi:hypothetical protein